MMSFVKTGCCISVNMYLFFELSRDNNTAYSQKHYHIFVTVFIGVRLQVEELNSNLDVDNAASNN